MAHHKRRKRKKYGVKGHCTMCAMATRRGGLRNRRNLSPAERRAADSASQQMDPTHGC